MKKYKHLFFDLDRTLWDFEANALETFQDLYKKYQLKEQGISSFDGFYTLYKAHNHRLWDEYRAGKISKETLSVSRFELTLKDFGIHSKETAIAMAADYLRISPTKTRLFPQALETLEQLKRRFKIHIITNGFNEVQFIKLKNSGIGKFIETTITSEDAGCKKPDPAIFRYSLEKAHAIQADSLMIGDDLEVDIKGAKSAGIDQVFVNFGHQPHDLKPTYEISELQQLTEILSCQ